MTHTTKVEIDDAEARLFTKVSFEAEIEPGDIGRLMELSRSMVRITVTFSSPQHHLFEAERVAAITDRDIAAAVAARDAAGISAGR